MAKNSLGKSQKYHLMAEIRATKNKNRKLSNYHEEIWVLQHSRGRIVPLNERKSIYRRIMK